MTTKAYAAGSATAPLAPHSFARREPRPTDVELDILFCGVCHSDLHTARNEWAAWPTVYPCVPGHEIVGRVTRVGPAVTTFKPGDKVKLEGMPSLDGSYLMRITRAFREDGTEIGVPPGTDN